MKRKGMSKRIRFEVFKRDRFTCQYCGRSAPDVVLHVDHIIPVAEGGTNDMMNLVTSCQDCNLGKSAKMLSDDAAVVKQRNQMQELSEREEQIQMILEWRKGLQELDRKSEEIIEKEFCAAYECEEYKIKLSQSGKLTIRKLLKQFSVKEILKAIDICSERYNDPDIALQKLSGICYIEKHYNIKRHCFNYLRKSMNDRFFFSEYKLRIWVNENIKTQEDFDAAKKAMSSATSFNGFVYNYFQVNR